VVDDLKVVFIDDGLMREGEPEQVFSLFKERGLDITVVNAQKEFFDSLKGITDPEEKRKAFRNTFYTVLGRILKDILDTGNNSC